MTDFANKARNGRLAALGALRINSADGAHLSTGGGRFHAGARQDVVIFLSRRSGSSTGITCG